MHLLVLSAFRQADLPVEIVMHAGLNAPSGAQCFPTTATATACVAVWSCLNAPSGAQCFPTKEDALMNTIDMSLNAPSGAQCFPTGWEAACVG